MNDGFYQLNTWWDSSRYKRGDYTFICSSRLLNNFPNMRPCTLNLVFGLEHLGVIFFFFVCLHMCVRHTIGISARNGNLIQPVGTCSVPPLMGGFYPINCYNRVGVGDVLKTRAGLGQGQGRHLPPCTRLLYNRLIKTWFSFLTLLSLPTYKYSQ
jgi:hypothetical protein